MMDMHEFCIRVLHASFLCSGMFPSLYQHLAKLRLQVCTEPFVGGFIPKSLYCRRIPNNGQHAYHRTLEKSKILHTIILNVISKNLPVEPVHIRFAK